MVKCKDSEARLPKFKVRIPESGCGTLGKLLTFSEPPFSGGKMGKLSLCLPEGTDDSIHSPCEAITLVLP